MELLERKEYLDFLKRHRDRHIIKVVSGARRCGKSKLFELFQRHLLEHHALYEYVTSHIA